MDWTPKNTIPATGRRARRARAAAAARVRPADAATFELESLEPRLLLSASPADPLATDDQLLAALLPAIVQDAGTAAGQPGAAAADQVADQAVAPLLPAAMPVDALALEPMAASATGTVKGTVYDWNSHVELSGVSVSIGSGGGTTTTGSAGDYTLSGVTTGTSTVTASLPATQLGRTINSASALAALRLSVGINPNPTVNGVQLPVSPYQYIAADMNGDGRVTSADALAILRSAVGQANAIAPSWVFVPETTTYFDPSTQTSTVSASAVPTSFAPAQPVQDGSTVNLVGILKGDVLGKYVPYDATGAVVPNPPTLPASTFTALSASTGAPASVWGVSGAATLTLAAALTNDTGVSATDGITSDATIGGRVGGGLGPITSLKGGLDTTPASGYASLTDLLDGSGNFTVTPARLATVLGTPLADGAHTLHLAARDVNGNAANLDVSFTLITGTPVIAALALSPASGSATDNTTSAASVAVTGTATTGASVTIGGQSGLAGGNGAFQVGGIALHDGANTLVATVTDKAGNTAQQSITITKQGTLAADQTLIWNQAVLDTARATAIYPEDTTRVLAMVALAQYDTLAAIQGSPAYLVSHAAPGTVSIDLALAKAADTVLTNLFPSRQAVFDAMVATVAAGVTDPAVRAASLALGTDIGQTVYDIRATDGSGTFVDYTGSTVVGKWRPTGPMYLVAEDPQWGSVTPFALTSGSEFRAPPPPAVGSAEYAAALNEVESLGSATSTTRTADQTQMAQFWADGKGSYTPPGHWVQIAEQVALSKGNSLADNVRLFAKLNVALADSAIAAWDTKYTYGTWRPDTAIHNADQDGNDATTADPNWTPLLIDPAHPDYVSGHSTFSSAAAAVLADTFGDNTAFSTTAVTLPGVTRSFTSFSQAAAEAGRSRVYAGIHTQTAKAAGATIGQEVAAAVLARFSLSQDTQPPTVIAPATPAVSAGNLTFAGTVVDNISGVAAAQISIDGAAATALPLDSAGHFSVTTGFKLDGTADGAHSLTVTTSDKAGNVATPVVRSFTLDTRAPTIALTSLADGDVLSGNSRVSGTASGTGSALVQLTLSVDGGKPAGLVYDANGGFDQALPIANLAIGAHSLVLTAQDSAGNTVALTRTVNVAALASFTVTRTSIANGASDVGTTQRPQVFFSRAVNPATLTASSFYATGADGSVLSTTIVPAEDGSFAWLFPNAPLPGGATVTVHVVGSAIRAAADGAFLDGDADGTPGGTYSFSFTTVSLAPVSGTKLVGRVVDPGPDLEPMTFDDIGRGPDGIIHTADDVFKLPIAGAKVYILGRETQVVYTDANGLFELDDIPAGTVKVAVDGRTATNSPSGVFFPEMVMSADIKPGVTNTLMDSVGTDASQAANAGRLEVYLPRVQTAVLQPVSDTASTVVTLQQSAAGTLTTEQTSELSLTVAPGSAVGADGKPLANVTVGVSVVPPELVKDMLPPGVLQHTFDITIQAPGVSTFTTPAQIVFPNVFNAAPGTKLNVLSFDHTTGMLVINGTATVSADGKTVVSDPDGGIKAPGWHGLTPPGGPSDPPCPPAEPATVKVPPVVMTSGLQDRFFFKDGDTFSMSFGNGAQKIDPDTDPCSPTNVQATPLIVDIKVEGPNVGDFLSADLMTTQYTLYPQQVENVNVTVKTLLDQIKNIPTDRLYGAKVTINAWASDDPSTLLINNKNVYIYRFLDAADSKHDDGVVEMQDTTNDGAGGVWRERGLDDLTGVAKPVLNIADTTNFSNIELPNKFLFDPTVTQNDLTAQLTITDPDGTQAGTLTLKGDGVRQTYYVDTNAFMTELTALSTNPALTATERGLLDTAAKRQAIIDGTLARVATLDTPFAAGVDRVSSSAGATTIFNTFDTAAGVTTYGQSAVIDNTGNGGLETAGGLLAKRTTYSVSEQDFRLSETLDENTGKTVAMHLRNFFDGVDSVTAQAVINGIAKSMAHEMGHSVGLNHTAGNGKSTGLPGATTDIMAQGSDYNGTRSWSESATDAYDVAVGITYTDAQAQTALNYYAAYIAAGGDFDAAESTADPNHPIQSAIDGAVPWVMSPSGDTFVTGTVDLGAVAADGAGGASIVKQFKIANVGNTPLTIDSFGLSSSVPGLTVSSIPAGTTIATGASLGFTVTFDPAAGGKVTGQFVMRSNATAGDYTFAITGRAISPNADLDLAVPNDNVGGQQVGSGSKAVPSFGTITNDGASDLVITGVATTNPSFVVTGFPAGLSATAPLVLHPNDVLTFGVTFQPGVVGLQHGLIQIASNDPNRPVASWGVVGTGLKTGALSYGQDYVALDQPDNASVPVVRTKSDDMGGWSFFLPNDTHVHYVIFDPVSGLISSEYARTAPSGQTTKFSQLDFRASTANDSDFDGIPDDIEAAIGSNPASRDTNKDGIDDFTALQQGLDITGTSALPTGVVASTALKGTATAVAVSAAAGNANKLTAYVATDSAGLAIVDVSQFDKPVLLSQLALPGSAGGVAVDAGRNLVAVADGAAGLEVVDVSVPTAPVVTQTVALPSSASRVALLDGIAYVANGSAISTVDITTGEVRQTVDLKGGTLTDLVFGGTTLFTMDTGNKLTAVTISGDVITPRGTLTLAAGGGRLTVGGTVAYVAAGNGGTGGYSTVDVSNLDSLALLSGVDGNGVAGVAIALNGSGQALAVGSSNFVFGGYKAADLLSVTDPANTANLVTRINLPGAPADVAIANGIAFVADGTAGLQVVNYLGFDTKGVAPTVSIATDAADVDASKSGVQVIEGTTLHITPVVSDDVQVRNVELLVNGKVVANDPSYPFAFSVAIPAIASGGTSVTIQARATDTGGNTTLSAPTTLSVVPDTYPPTVVSTSLAEGARVFFVRSLQVTFSEPLDTTRLAASGVSLVAKGPDGQFGTADDVSTSVKLDTRGGNQVLSVIPSGYLPAGDYRLTISPSIIADRVGNALTAPITLDFTIRPASDIRAATGTPAAATAPSANPGQVIAVSVPFDPATAYATFAIIDTAGATSTRDVKAVSVDPAKGVAYFKVPDDANTGDAVVYSLVGSTKTGFTDGTFLLQVIPVVTGITVQSVSSDGSSAVVVLSGSGFVEGGGSYGLGSTVVVDQNASQGPDVSYGYVGNSYVPNGTVTLTVPLSNGAFGAVTVTTAGGTSTGYVAGLSSVVGAALSGTAADGSVASANPGQAVTLVGSGLSTATTVLFHYVDAQGTARTVGLSPIAASSDGTRATLVVPSYANGVGRLQVFGSVSQPVLQIVPVLTGYSASSAGTLSLSGAGFVEDATTYTLPGSAVVDGAGGSADVTYGYYNATYTENGAANVPVSTYGSGSVSVTTAGGTSAALALGVVNPGLGALYDVAAVPGSGSLWVVDGYGTGRLDKVDAATGTVLSTVVLTAGGFGSASNYSGTGLQVLPGAMTLGTTSVAAGSLLLFNGTTSPDRVTAVNPATGAVLATLSLGQDYSVSGGAYDAASGHLFVLDRRASPTRVVELSASNASVIGTFDLPFNAGEGGLAVNPATGHLWYVSDQGGSTAVELSRTGTVLRTLSLSLSGVPGGLTGVSFDASGTTLYASTNQGLVFKVDLTQDPVAQKGATLTGITGVSLDGTPAVAAQASANVGQVVTLTGTNFGTGTQVLFATRDNAGVTGLTGVLPLAVNAAGTQLQVVVPNLATTGLVRVVNTGTQNLDGVGYPDAVYRQVTLSYTPAAATSSISFADLGLEGVSNESWGIDNVRVVQAGATVFSDDFEGASKPNWSSAAVDGAAPGVFSRFSGRFSNGSQVLSLSGLTAGQAVTLVFDLYVLDSWDGGSSNAGPDVFGVTADGQVLMRDTFSNEASNSAASTQSYGASAGVRLQVVPTLTATGQPGGDGSFTLTGSGFQEGASTVTVGGVSFADTLTGVSAFSVSGNRNGSYQVSAPLTLDGPVKVTTEGGSASLAGPVLAAQPPSLFTGIAAVAGSGAAADAGKASANVGQSIVLTGQGFTGSTLVQFAAVDAAGVAGTVTRTGTANAAGTQLTVVVPALARTGAVTVLGSGTSVSLQVVPLLRGVGGTVTAGGTVLLDGTGLVGSELTVSVDGRGAGSFSVRNVADVGGYASLPEQGQQLLSLVLPAGTSSGVITVTTAGGSFTVHAGVAVTAATLSPAGDVGDTLAAATAVALGPDGRVVVSGATNDGAAGSGLDVDLFKVALAAGDQLSVGLVGSSYSVVRVFNAAGVQLSTQTASPSGTAPLLVTAPGAGTYYVGISGYGNTGYNPATAGSGTASGYTGSYQLTLERLGGGDSRVAGITAAAAAGTPAQAGVASANTGQVITLTGSGFVSGDSVLFSAIDYAGTRYWSTATPASVAADGSSLTVVVPADATTGTVRLARDPAGVLLQVVPRLTHVDDSAGGGYDGSTLTLTGTGFAEGATTVLFGSVAEADTSRTDGLDVGYGNASLYVTVPTGAPTGALRVVTVGGTSDTAGPALGGITATAGSGTAASGAAASANPGQTITVTGANFDTATEFVIPTIDASGTRGQVLVKPTTVGTGGTSATVVLPTNAVTGSVRAVGDQNAAAIALQVVPVLTGLTVQSVSSDGSSAVVVLSGSGFVEGGGSYGLGSTVVVDQNASQGPDVSYGYVGNSYVPNGTVTLTVPLSNGAFGAVTVTTAGGTSVSYSVSLASVTATAATGTPANANLASANPGQTVTLNGAGLTTATTVLFHYVDSGGTAQTVALQPATATADGTAATLVVPANANGAGRLQVFGSSSQPVLQIVPVLTGFTASGNTSLSLAGQGLVEGATTYTIPGATIVDTSAGTGPDVTAGYVGSNYVDNSAVNIPVTSYGAGSVTVMTAGGTSAALALNVFDPGLSNVTDVAVDTAGSAVWLVDGYGTGQLNKVDPATGSVLATVPFTAAGFGTTSNYYGSGLQVAPATFTLGSTSVPASSLLLFDGTTSPDRVTAVSPTTGAVLATLSLGQDYSVSGGAYDTGSGHLFVLDRRNSPTRVVELNPATAAVINGFNLSVDAGEGGLAVNPVTGNLWYVSDQSGNALELSKTGTVLRTLSLAAQNVPVNTSTGVSFNAAGTTMFVSTNRGLVFKAAV